MHRIDHATAAGSAPAPAAAGTPGYFTKGNPTGGTPATVVTDDWANDVQENLVEVILRAGASLTKGRKQDLADAIELLISNAYAGLLVGRFEYATASTMKLARTHKGVLRVEVNGAVITKSDADLVFDLSAHLETGTEAVSTWYYFYVSNSAGVLVPHISVTPPVLSAPAKVGYHPTNTGWRYVGANLNCASGDLLEIDSDADGTRRGRWHQDTATQFVNLGTSAPTTYVALDLAGRIPVTARSVLLVSHTHGDSFYPFYGPERLIGLAASSFGPLHFNAANNDVEAAFAGHGGNGVVEFWIAVDSSPRIAWAIAPGVELALNHTLTIAGWRE